MLLSKVCQCHSASHCSSRTVWNTTINAQKCLKMFWNYSHNCIDNEAIFLSFTQWPKQFVASLAAFEGKIIAPVASPFASHGYQVFTLPKNCGTNRDLSEVITTVSVGKWLAPIPNLIQLLIFLWHYNLMYKGWQYLQYFLWFRQVLATWRSFFHYKFCGFQVFQLHHHRATFDHQSSEEDRTFLE